MARWPSFPAVVLTSSVVSGPIGPGASTLPRYGARSVLPMASGLTAIGTAARRATWQSRNEAEEASETAENRLWVIRARNRPPHFDSDERRPAGMTRETWDFGGSLARIRVRLIFDKLS